MNNEVNTASSQCNRRCLVAMPTITTNQSTIMHEYIIARWFIVYMTHVFNTGYTMHILTKDGVLNLKSNNNTFTYNNYNLTSNMTTTAIVTNSMMKKNIKK